jgi:hypothetical protein
VSLAFASESQVALHGLFHAFFWQCIYTVAMQMPAFGATTVAFKNTENLSLQNLPTLIIEISAKTLENMLWVSQG